MTTDLNRRTCMKIMAAIAAFPAPKPQPVPPEIKDGDCVFCDMEALQYCYIDGRFRVVKATAPGRYEAAIPMEELGPRLQARFFAGWGNILEAYGWVTLRVSALRMLPREKGLGGWGDIEHWNREREYAPEFEKRLTSQYGYEIIAIDVGHPLPGQYRRLDVAYANKDQQQAAGYGYDLVPMNVGRK